MTHSTPKSFGTKTDVFYGLTTSGFGSSIQVCEVREVVGESAHQGFAIRRMLMDVAAGACFWRLHSLEVLDEDDETVGRFPLQGVAALTAFTMLGGPTLNFFVRKGCRVRILIENIDCAPHGFSLVLQGEHDSRDP